MNKNVGAGDENNGRKVMASIWMTEESTVKEKAVAERRPIFVDIRNPN